MTEGSEYLHPNKYIEDVLEHLIKFETDIIESMKVKGWDGIEDEEQIQWTFSGALFYSIIVITTIGSYYKFIYKINNLNLIINYLVDFWYKISLYPVIIF